MNINPKAKDYSVESCSNGIIVKELQDYTNQGQRLVTHVFNDFDAFEKFMRDNFVVLEKPKAPENITISEFNTRDNSKYKDKWYRGGTWWSKFDQKGRDIYDW